MEAESSFSALGSDGENAQYYNSKFSNSSISDETITISSSFDPPKGGTENYTTLNLAADPHFDNVLVNVDYSSVHVPTNIFDRCKYQILTLKLVKNNLLGNLHRMI